MHIAAVESVRAIQARPAAASGKTQPFSEVLAAGPAAPMAPPARPADGGAEFLRTLGEGQRRLDEIVARARSGRAFSPRELLALQAQVYRISEQVSLAQRVVEEGLSGIKRLWTMQL